MHSQNTNDTSFTLKFQIQKLNKGKKKKRKNERKENSI